MKRCALYVRVSTQEQKQHGLSVDSQIEALQAYVNEKGYTVAGLYNDAGISARKKYTKRPALLQLAEDIKANKIDLVLFTKLDRWFRSVGDYYEVQKVLDANKVAWRAIWEDYETETSNGIFKVNIMLSVAQAEADKASERVKAVMDYKREKGDHLGHIPFGYNRIEGKLYKNKDAHYVDLIFKTYLETHSICETVRVIYSAGLVRSRSFVYRLLNNPIYAGTISAEAYVTEEVFNQVQEIRQTKNRRENIKNTFTHYFSGLCVCALCGNRMKVNVTYYNDTAYTSYYCNGLDGIEKHLGKNVSLSERKIEKYLLSSLDDILSEYNNNLKLEVSQTATNDYKKQLDRLNSRLERIGIRYEEGDISTEEYKEKRRAIKKEIALLQKPKEYKPVVMPTGWRDMYTQLDAEHKKRFWLSIIKDIKIDNNRHITVTFW